MAGWPGSIWLSGGRRRGLLWGQPPHCWRTSETCAGGLAKTIVGFLAGIVGTQFIVAQPLPRFVVFFAATIVHAVVFMGLYVLLDVRHFGTPVAAVSGQALGNAVVGVVAFQVAELLPGAMERRRAQKTRLRR